MTKSWAQGEWRKILAVCPVGATLVLVLCTCLCADEAPRIENPSFEADVFKTYPGLAHMNGGRISGWKFTGQVGVNPIWAGAPERKGPQRPFVDNGMTPHGRQVALMQNRCTLSQTITGLKAGKRYRIAYFESARHMRRSKVPPRLVVTVNGEKVVSEHEVRCVDAPDRFTLPYDFVESIPFTAPEIGSADLVFKTTIDRGVTVLLDQVTIQGLR